MSGITVEELESALPAQFSKGINQDVVNNINQKLNDPDMYMAYRENLLGFTQVMKEGRFNLGQYVDAVKYISFRMMNKTRIESFTLVFPDRMKDWVAKNKESKDIASLVSSYDRSKMIKLLYEQTMTPSYVMNQDIYQEAINSQADLMRSANSEKVRCDAANSLLTHLKPPETTKVEIDIGTKEDSAIANLRQVTADLVEKQRQVLSSGSMKVIDVAHQKLTAMPASELEEELNTVIDIEDAEVVEEEPEPVLNVVEEDELVIKARSGLF